MSRSLPLVVSILAVACGTSQPDLDKTPASVQGEDPITSDTQDWSQLSPAEVSHRYYDAVCRLYVEPSCVQSQKDSCRAHLGFATTDECAAWMRKMGGDCPDLEPALHAAASDVKVCAESLAAHDCAATPVCLASGDRVDSAGACARAAAVVAKACPADDTGL